MMLKFSSFFIVLLVIGVVPAHAEEVQSHGFSFEQQVWNHLFGRGYTDDWDIPGAANLENPGVPISVKYIGWKNSIYLGDAIRQRSIDEPFEMVVGFYETSDSGNKETVALHRLSFSPQEWGVLWGEITVEDLTNLAEAIQHGSIEEAQDFARKRAAELRAQSPVMSINPKINKDQRRIQCSIPFTVFYREVLRQKPAFQEKIELWGRPFEFRDSEGIP